PWPFGHDDSRAVNSRHQGESWAAGYSPRTVANCGIPDTDAGRIDLDEHLLRTRPRHRNFVQSESRGRTESIDGPCFHGVREMTGRVVPRSRELTMSHRTVSSGESVMHDHRQVATAAGDGLSHRRRLVRQYNDGPQWRDVTDAYT